MQRIYRLRQFISIAAVFAMMAMSPSAPAQTLAAGDNGQPDNSKSSQFGIALPDSNAATDLLKKAATEEIQKHWDTAADLYLQAITQYPSRVVPVDQDAAGYSHYSGIAEEVQQRLSKWPADGLAVYNDLYGKTARDLLHAAKPGDVGMLSNIFHTYFATDSGRSAGIQLMDANLEQGDFLAARRIGNQLLRFHPALENDRGITLFRTALADHYSGDEASAMDLLSRLKIDDPTGVACIGGKDTGLVDSLTAALKIPAQGPTTRPTDADTYPCYGGIGECGEISNSKARFGTKLTSVPLTPPEYPGAMGNRLAAFLSSDQFSTGTPLATAIIPVVDEGALLFQDGRSLYAIDPDTGDALPGWLKTYPGSRHGRYKLSAFGKARGQLLTVTVTPAAVLAVMGQDDPLALMASVRGQAHSLPAAPASTVKLVCLDRTTGRERWSRSPAELPESTGLLRRGEYDGTPLIIPGRFSAPGEGGTPEDLVLVTVRTGRNNQFDDCYVVCLSLKSGAYRWSTYLGGATHQMVIRGDSSQMAFANGRVFVMTNLGALAAMEPANGHLIWLNSYPHESEEQLQDPVLPSSHFTSQAGGHATSSAWEHNPVIISNGNVFILPNDSKTLFVCDADTGLLLAALPMTDWDDANQLLGIRNGLLLICSDRKVFSVDWRNYSPQAKTLNVTRYATNISFLDNSKVCGRGFVTADSIFVPTTHRLVQIMRGRAIATFPLIGSFSPPQTPGNLLATSNAIIVAGQAKIDIYTNAHSLNTRKIQ